MLLREAKVIGEGYPKGWGSMRCKGGAVDGLLGKMVTIGDGTTGVVMLVNKAAATFDIMSPEAAKAYLRDRDKDA